MVGRIFAIAALLAIAGEAQADVATSDTDSQQIVAGLWTIKPDTTDMTDKVYLDSGRRVVEKFDSDGTGESIGYTDSSCSHIFVNIKWSWKVISGSLETTYASGAVGVAKINILSKDSFTLLTSDGRTLERLRAIDCNTPKPSAS